MFSRTADDRARAPVFPTRRGAHRSPFDCFAQPSKQRAVVGVREGRTFASNSNRPRTEIDNDGPTGPRCPSRAATCRRRATCDDGESETAGRTCTRTRRAHPFRHRSAIALRRHHIAPFRPALPPCRRYDVLSAYSSPPPPPGRFTALRRCCASRPPPPAHYNRALTTPSIPRTPPHHRDRVEPQSVAAAALRAPRRFSIAMSLLLLLLFGP